MTHATRFVAAAVLVALVVCLPVQAQTTEVDAVRVRAEAQFNLGVMYDNGVGVPQNYVEAVRWIRLTAEQGDARARSYLGRPNAFMGARSLRVQTQQGPPPLTGFRYVVVVQPVALDRSDQLAVEAYNLKPYLEERLRSVGWESRRQWAGDADLAELSETLVC